MSSKMLMIRNSFTSKFSNIRTKLSTFEIPERFKGTIVEKWAKYWKQLGIDYKEAGISFFEEAKAKPLKTSIYTILGTTAYLCGKRNPSEIDFIENLRSYNNDLILVNESCHNLESSNHLKFLEKCLNEGILRRFTLGVVSFMWIADYDKSVALYKAICPHLQQDYTKFHNRVVDVGFWNKWWELEKKMVDYDVNI